MEIQRNALGQFMLGGVSFHKGKHHTAETNEKNRLAHLGKTAWNKGTKGVMVAWNKGKKMSDATREKVRQANLGKKQTTETRIKKSLGMRGDKNPRWKGGKSFWQPSEKKHLSAQYVNWATEVKKRDGWKCKIADGNCCGRLEAHHILSWIEHPELRYNINNGISLCKKHHPIKRTLAKELEPMFYKLLLQPIPQL